MQRRFRINRLALAGVLLSVTLSHAVQLSAQEAASESTSPATDPQQTLQRLAEMMERDWTNPPEWAQMATALLKREDIGPGKGWYKPGESRYSWDWVLQVFDADKNGTIAAAELPQAEKYLAHLDHTADGNLTAADFEPRSTGGRADPPTMAGSILFRMLDSDSNGKVTPEELSLFFVTVDQDQAGFLTATDLQAMFRQAPQQLAPPPNQVAEYQPGVDPIVDLDMLLSGQLGSFSTGPAVNDMAPDFTLPKHDGSGTLTLSQLRGKPVVLIFGSFT